MATLSREEGTIYDISTVTIENVSFSSIKELIYEVSVTSLFNGSRFSFISWILTTLFPQWPTLGAAADDTICLAYVLNVNDPITIHPANYTCYRGTTGLDHHRQMCRTSGTLGRSGAIRLALNASSLRLRCRTKRSFTGYLFVYQPAVGFSISAYENSGNRFATLWR